MNNIRTRIILELFGSWNNEHEETKVTEILRRRAATKQPKNNTTDSVTSSTNGVISSTSHAAESSACYIRFYDR